MKYLLLLSLLTLATNVFAKSKDAVYIVFSVSSDASYKFKQQIPEMKAALMESLEQNYVIEEDQSKSQYTAQVVLDHGEELLMPGVKACLVDVRIYKDDKFLNQKISVENRGFFQTAKKCARSAVSAFEQIK